MDEGFMANIEDRQKNLEKRLSYNKVVVGILAFCLMLAVAAHLDAQPKPPGLGTRPGSQQIDSRRLNQILAKIEQRLTSLEKQRVSHQPAAPAMHQPGPSHGQASIESRVTALEQKVSQQPAAQAANQMSSSPDLTTIEARLAALENQAGSSQPAVASAASLTAEHLTCRSLKVVDGAGQTLVWLGETSPPGGIVKVNNGAGITVAKVRGNTNSGGGSVSVHEPTGSARAYLQVDQTNLSGILSLLDSESQKVMAGTAQGAGFIHVEANNQMYSVP
jgi:uncharacterized coiled-coil protein SlyX